MASKKETTFDRHEDSTWKVASEDGNPCSIEGSILCVLQDIRRELKTLNETVKRTRFLAYAHDGEDHNE
jgi:hypothetical protein